MPRSTGGGSHSGGSRSSSHSSHSSGGSHSGGSRSSSHSFHSSGGYSFSRSSSSSFGAGSYGGSSARSKGRSPYATAFVSPQRFAGATRYVCYRDHQPLIFYSNYENLRREKHHGRLTFYIILVLMLILGFWNLFTPPQKLNNRFNRDILIEDGLAVIEDRAALEQSLEAFLDATGIAPAVITLTNESWSRFYSSLAVKALDLYVNRFDDEMHWLIVYSEPAEPDPAFVDWFWEGVAGDDTDKILTDDAVDAFSTRLQRYLTNENISVGEAISRAFDYASANMMTSEYDPSDLPTALFVVIGFILLGARRSGYWPGRAKRPKELPRDAVADETTVFPEESGAKPVQASVDKTPAEITCDYCGAVLTDGAAKCPWCGAARKKTV